MWGTLTIIDYNLIILCEIAMAILCHVIWDPLHHAECGSKTNVKATLCIPNFATTCYSHQNCRLHTCMCTLKHLKPLGWTFFTFCKKSPLLNQSVGLEIFLQSSKIMLHEVENSSQCMVKLRHCEKTAKFETTFLLF